MRILIVNHFPLAGSGSGVYVSNIAKNLIKLGHEVCVITPENSTKDITIPGVLTKHVFFTRKEIIEGQIPFNFPCIETHPKSTETFREYTDEQLSIYKNSFRKVIQEAIDEFKPEVIHAQHIWVLSDVISGFNIPFVITAHGSDLIGYKLIPRYKNECINAVEKCKKIIAISKENYKEVIETFEKAKDKTSIIKNGYDKNVFKIKDIKRKEVLESLEITKNYKNVVTYAGRLSPHKGIEILLEAAKEYENSQTATLIVGGGALKKKLMEQANNLKLKNVYFLGSKSQKKLCDIYNISDVLAVPSRKEAFGLVALEAIACGVPVVASNIGGMKDFVTEKVGVLVNVNDSEMLASNIKQILNKEKIFKKEELANYAVTNYPQENFMDSLINIYKECL